MKKAFLGFCLVAASASVVQAHYGQRVWVDVGPGGKIKTLEGPPGDYIGHTYLPSEFSPSRVFTRDMGPMGDITPGVNDGGNDDDEVNYATEFPGYEATKFPSTSFSGTFRLDIVGEVRYFDKNAGQFVPVSQAFSGNPIPYFTVGDDTTYGASPSNDSIVPASLAFTVGTHYHPEDTLIYGGGPSDAHDAYDGIYALGLRLTQSGYMSSDKFYLILGKNAPLSELQQADAVANIRMNRIPGDANCDGVVDVADLTILARHWQTVDDSWFSADFDDNGLIDIRDLYSMATHWGDSQSLSTAMAAVGLSSSLPVPEPACLSVLTIAIAAMSRRRSNNSLSRRMV